MKTTKREQIFAKRLKEMRKKRGITQTELAEKCMFAKSVISLMESQKIIPSVGTVNFIAKKLDCSIYDLLT